MVNVGGGSGPRSRLFLMIFPEWSLMIFPEWEPIVPRDDRFLMIFSDPIVPRDARSAPG